MVVEWLLNGDWMVHEERWGVKKVNKAEVASEAVGREEIPLKVAWKGGPYGGGWAHWQRLLSFPGNDEAETIEADDNVTD